MIPALAVMAGFYIVTRCAEVMVRERERAGTMDTGPAVLAALTIAVTAGAVAWVIWLSIETQTAADALLLP